MEDRPKNPNEPAAALPEQDESPEKRGPTPDKVMFYLALALAVLALVWYFGGHAYRRITRLQRVRTQVDLAEKCLREQNFTEARQAISTAASMAPNDPRVLRITAIWCSETGHPKGFEYWDRLFAITPPTRADLLKKLDLSLALHRFAVSRSVLNDLLRTNANDREVLVREVIHVTQSGGSEFAIPVARAAVSNQPTDAQLQFMLGGLLLESTNQLARLEARGVLWNVAIGDSEWRESAVDRLVRGRVLRDEDRAHLIRSLESRDPVTLRDRLRVLGLKLAAASDRERALGESENLRVQYPGLTNQLILASWLSDVGATNLALAMISREATRTNRAAAGAHLDLLVRFRAWEEVGSFLQQPPPALKPSQVEAAQGLVASATGRGPYVTGYFESALQKASGQPGELIQVAAYAEVAQLPVLAAGALLDAAALKPLSTVQLGLRALALVQPIESMALARQTLERLGEVLPDEPSVLLERSWVDLLFGEEIDRAQAALAGLLNHPVRGQEAQVLLAFADLRRGDAEAALARIEALTVEPAHLTPRLQAVYVAVLLANNRLEAARRLTLLIPPSQLRKLELELIAPLL